MHAALHHAANAGNKIRRRRDPDDAGGGADHVDHVVGAAAGADGVPVRVERANRDRNAGLQSKFLGPIGESVPAI